MLAIPPDKYRTIDDFLFETARRFPNRLAVQDDASSLTYGELAAQARQFGTRLHQQGLAQGDRVVVHLPNNASFLRTHFGVLRAGGVSVPVESTANPHSVAAIAKAADARWICLDEAQLERFKAAVGAVGDTELLPISAVQAHTPDAADEEGDASRDPKALACLLFTTGSTAQAKGVPLRHENVCAAIENLVVALGYSERDREVIILPLAHSFGLGHVYCNFRVGGAVRVLEGMSKVGRVLKALREFGATGFPGTPLGFGLLLDRYEKLFQDAAQSLRFIVVNSAPLPPQRATQLMAVLPSTALYVYYGLTEASRSTLLALNGVSPERLTSVGRAMRGIDVRVDGEDGRPLPAGAVGQVTITGPTVPGTYWRDELATAEGYRDGRLLTGDLGHLDDEGFLYITGRLKDQINIGGLKVAGAEIESVLREHPDVEDCAVLGLPSLTGVESESVVACVTLRGAVTLDEAALQSFLRGKMEPMKVPTEIYRLSHIPRAATGKLLRPQVRALAISARGTA
jgi:long-chain acyl-CoA synthetase